MKKLLVASTALAALAIGIPAEATVISIDDLTDTLGLRVWKPSDNTSPGHPGDGNVINLTGCTLGSPCNSPENGLSLITVGGNVNHETLSFTFTARQAWPNDVLEYQYFKEAGDQDGANGLSDLLVIEGIQGKFGNLVDFISATNLAGDISKDFPVSARVTNATPTQISDPVFENGDWQLAADLVTDQVYVGSDVPEPSTLGLLGAGLLAFGPARRKRG